MANLLFLFKIFSSSASSSSEELQNEREFLWGFHGSALHQNGKNSDLYKHFILYQLTILNDHQPPFIGSWSELVAPASRLAVARICRPAPQQHSDAKKFRTPGKKLARKHLSAQPPRSKDLNPDLPAMEQDIFHAFNLFIYNEIDSSLDRAHVRFVCLPHTQINLRHPAIAEARRLVCRLSYGCLTAVQRLQDECKTAVKQ
ncbi:MAG: hypothetical protein WB424_14435 [Terracidiphilus sp.]